MTVLFRFHETLEQGGSWEYWHPGPTKPISPTPTVPKQRRPSPSECEIMVVSSRQTRMEIERNTSTYKSSNIRNDLSDLTVLVMRRRLYALPHS
jgi:hypothetical protein